MTDLMGVAAIIAASGTVLVGGYAQFNTRRAARDAKQAALDAKTAVEAAATEAARVAEEQKIATAEVHTLVNSKSDAQESKINALMKEIIRLQHPDSSTPSAHDPAEKPAVTLNGGVVTVEKQMKRRGDDTPDNQPER